MFVVFKFKINVSIVLEYNETISQRDKIDWFVG